MRLEVESRRVGATPCSPCSSNGSSSRPKTSTRVPGPLDLRAFLPLVDLPTLEDLRDPAEAGRSHRRSAEADIFALLGERDVLLHHPYDSFEPVVASCRGRQRSRRARHQADAVPHQRRIADRREPAPRRGERQAGHRARRADGALRRGAQHPLGARLEERAPTSSTASAGTRPTPRSAWSCGAAPRASSATSTSAPATTTSRPRASTPTSA